jgi:hypothetical protein
MAMEKLLELSVDARWDLVVLDTPPTRHALDFLEAPERMLEFLESPVVRLMLHPAFAAGRTGFRLFQRGAARVLKLLERVSGLGFLEDISQFLLAFEGIGGLPQRAHGEGLSPARRRATARVGPGADDGAGRRARRSAGAVGRQLSGLVVNRMHLWPGRTGGAFSAEASALSGTAAAHGARYPARGRTVHSGSRALRRPRRRDAGAIEPPAARVRARGGFVTRIRFDRDVHDLDGLPRSPTCSARTPEWSRTRRTRPTLVRAAPRAARGSGGIATLALVDAGALLRPARSARLRGVGGPHARRAEAARRGARPGVTR